MLMVDLRKNYNMNFKPFRNDVLLAQFVLIDNYKSVFISNGYIGITLFQNSYNDLVRYIQHIQVIQ
jgi:hypothetical protein